MRWWGDEMADPQARGKWLNETDKLLCRPLLETISRDCYRHPFFPSFPSPDIHHTSLSTCGLCLSPCRVRPVSFPSPGPQRLAPPPCPGPCVDIVHSLLQ